MHLLVKYRPKAAVPAPAAWHQADRCCRRAEQAARADAAADPGRRRQCGIDPDRQRAHTGLLAAWTSDGGQKWALSAALGLGGAQPASVSFGSGSAIAVVLTALRRGQVIRRQAVDEGGRTTTLRAWLSSQPLLAWAARKPPLSFLAAHAALLDEGE